LVSNCFFTWPTLPALFMGPLGGLHVLQFLVLAVESLELSQAEKEMTIKCLVHVKVLIY
jgi:hypothetical protein